MVKSKRLWVILAVTMFFQSCSRGGHDASTPTCKCVPLKSERMLAGSKCGNSPRCGSCVVINRALYAILKKLIRSDSGGTVIGAATDVAMHKYGTVIACINAKHPNQSESGIPRRNGPGAQTVENEVFNPTSAYIENRLADQKRPMNPQFAQMLARVTTAFNSIMSNPEDLTLVQKAYSAWTETGTVSEGDLSRLKDIAHRLSVTEDIKEILALEIEDAFQKGGETDTDSTN